MDKTLNNYYNQNFKAIPVTKHKTGICVYELEKTDLPRINKISDNIDKFIKKNNINDTSRIEILKTSILAIQKILSSTNDAFNKTKIFIAEKNQKLCGILIGNVPKQKTNGNITYSSRKNQGKRETELDWLMTWNPFKKKKISKTGKILVNEFLKSTRDEFDKIYVRSEVPELSFAKSFYETLGFREVGKRRNITKQTDNKYLIGELDNNNEDIIPMIIRR